MSEDTWMDSISIIFDLFKKKSRNYIFLLTDRKQTARMPTTIITSAIKTTAFIVLLDMNLIFDIQSLSGISQFQRQFR